MFEELLSVVWNSPWKLVSEILMYLIKPWVLLYLKIHGVKIGPGAKFYGFPKIIKTRGSRIIIGTNFEARSWRWSNPLGVNHPLILCTWTKKAILEVSNDVGVSGGTISSAQKITIGNRVLIGANSTIIDTDFHPTAGVKRYVKENIKCAPVTVGDDAFIGMNAVLLKGTNITDNEIVPAGKVVR